VFTGSGRVSELSSARRKLVALLQGIDHGRIEGLIIRDGEPRFEAFPGIVRTFTFGRPPDRALKVRPASFEPKRALKELFAQFDRLRTGVITRLDVKDGLPCFMEMDDSDVEPSLGRGAGGERSK
jgi:hypothetical protein